ncbi:MAG: rRNA adenine N(6)-methyltransferase family protein [Actinomycetota bacterium]|nr:rRNA adenine N(6)-methyltransferase family protein [Actinomycetota bacterium]
MGQPRRSWGWHRLAAEQAEQLVADAALPRRCLVLDIGAGHGSLTAPLLVAGHRVIAVEAHPRRAAHLRERFGSKLTVIGIDARQLCLPRRPFHVVASPPYAITSPLLQLLLQHRSHLHSAHLVIQAQAARRWAYGRPPGAGRWRQSFDLTVLRPVPRQAFQPPPAVPSAVLRIRRRA